MSAIFLGVPSQIPVKNFVFFARHSSRAPFLLCAIFPLPSLTTAGAGGCGKAVQNVSLISTLPRDGMRNSDTNFALQHIVCPRGKQFHEIALKHGSN